MSLRRRLMIATGAAVLSGLTMVDVATFVVVSRSLVRQVDDTLGEVVAPIESVVSDTSDGDYRSIGTVAPGLFVAIVEPGGEVRYTVAAQLPGEESDTLVPGPLGRSRRTGTARSVEGHHMRVLVAPQPRGETLIVGKSLHEVNETRGKLAAALAATTVVALAGALACAHWLVGIGLRPLRRVEASAAEISDHDLGAVRVPGARDDNEVGRLAAALNAMLDRLDAARDGREQTVAALQASEARMRQFVADASHELRTPVAATAAYAELLESGAVDNPGGRARAAQGIRREAARMTALVDDLLLLARLDEGQPLVRGHADLTEIVLAAVDAAHTVDPDRPTAVKISGVVAVTGDAQRLRQVVDNLLANVRTHTPAGTACSVSLAVSEDGWATLTVSDHGPGVSDEQLAHLFDRFYRTEEARTRATGGSGLGLAIAGAIVTAHGGSIAAAHAQPSGLTVTVSLPLRTSDEGQTCRL